MRKVYSGLVSSNGSSNINAIIQALFHSRIVRELMHVELDEDELNLDITNC